MNTRVVKTFVYTLLGLGTLLVGIMLSKPLLKKYEDATRYDFTLQTLDGAISLEQFKGKSIAVYFGYMYCPDVCPTSLSALSEALYALSPQEQASFQGIFISVDPQRDTLDHLKEYSAYFHPNFLGATSQDESYLHAIVKNYGGSFRKVVLEGSDMGYSVNHTSDIYFFDKHGRFTGKTPHLASKETLLAALKKAL